MMVRPMPARKDRLSQELADLARRVRQLAPSHRDPERYHVEKSEIENALRRLSRTAGGEPCNGRQQETRK